MDVTAVHEFLQALLYPVAIFGRYMVNLGIPAHGLARERVAEDKMVVLVPPDLAT